MLGGLASRRFLRAPLALVAGVLGGATAIVVAAPPHDLTTLAAALGEEAGGCVEPATIRWEPSNGPLVDALLGRGAVFLASGSACDAPPTPRDVFRAEIRVTPEGAPLGIAGVYNLTSTPLGDDHSIVSQGDRVAFATAAYGQEQSVTALDLSGEHAQSVQAQVSSGTGTGTASFGDRVLAALTNVQQTGTREGVGRVDLALDEPARAVGLALAGSTLTVDLAGASGSGTGHARQAKLDLAKGELVATAPGMHAEASRHLPKRFVFWAVDTVRAVPWIGPAPIAWLEERTFWVRDQVKQLAFRFGGGDGNKEPAGADDLATTAQGSVTGASDPPPAILDAEHVGKDADTWPPPPVPSIWKTAEAGEGTWVPPDLPWMRAAIVGAPSPFYRTFVRPDSERPYTKVLLVAMDMRQFDLDMEAGVEDPKPLTGPHGSGRLPRDPGLAPRVMAAWNGAFKTEHGNYGMMVHKRVLLPPQPGAATIVTLDDGRVGLGTWGDTKDVTGIAGVDDAAILSFRQNMDALVDHGEVNPTGRALWGYTLPGSGMQTERSAMCVTKAGHLMYAWGDDVSATALGKAMSSAGCDYAMHLDMNPHHTGFIFATIHELKGHAYRSELLSPLMEVSTDRYIEYSPKDFFYLMAHDPTPPALGGKTPWAVDDGTQPAPAWLPGVWKNEEMSVSLTQIEPGRAHFRLRAGMREPDAKTGATLAHDLDASDAHSVLLAAPLGYASDKRPRALKVDGKWGFGFAAADAAALEIDADGALSIVTTPTAATADATASNAVEVPLLFDETGDHLSTNGPSSPRAALGTTPAGRVIFARADATSYAPLARALKDAGCTRAVALDRGVHADGQIDRAGTSEPPRARYDGSVLYALASPARPRGFRFEAAKAVAEVRGKIAP